jgi:hypothetical protein
MTAFVPIYTPMEVERFAWETLRKRPDIAFETPINLERLLIKLPNVDLQYEMGLRNDHRVEGCVCKEFMSRTITVWIDFHIMCGPWDGYHRVLGEEYAHIQLHPFIFENINSIEDFVEMQSHPQWARMEGDARRFSRAIRMPPTLVADELERLYPQVVNEVGFGNVEAVENRLKLRMAALFRVSPTEMMRRIADPPCNLRDQLLNSLQARSETLLESGWTVRAIPPGAQMRLFETSGW